MELLEREDELAELDERLAGVRATGRGRLVLLAGEAGVGKTALVRAFAERHPSVAVLAGGCEALFTPRPLGPLVDIAADTGGELAELVDGGASSADVLEALGRAFRGVRIVVLEDLHWADEATLDVLRLLGRRASRMRALVLATYRADELDRDHPLRGVLGELTSTDRLTLDPLSPAAVARLAADRGVDAADLHDRTGGNPFFVTEVLARDTWETPGSVRDAVLARAARLEPRARRLLEAVAVARPRAEIWLLEQIAPRELTATEACLASGMLRNDGNAVAFRHEIARAAIEDELPPDRRVALHRAALVALAGRGEPARLAHHAEAADDGAAVLEHATTAGDRAARLGAHREAAAHYAAALRHADGPARATLLERRSYQCFLAGQVAEATETRVAALAAHRAAGDRLREGDTLRWLSMLAWYAGDGARVGEALTSAIEVLEALAPGPELAMAYAQRATQRVFDFDLPGTLEWGARAIALAEQLGETDVLMSATRNVGTVEFSHGLPEGRDKLTAYLQWALDAGRHDHVGVAYSNLASSPMFRRDYATAESYLRAGRVFCREHDLRSWGTYLTGWSARIALDQGRWDHAAALAAQVFERTQGQLPQSRFTALIVDGVLHARRGDASPWPALDEALAIAESTSELQRLGPVAIARAEARWLAGQADRIDAETAGVLERAERSEHRWTIGELAVWRHRGGLRFEDPARLPPPHRAELEGDPGAAAAFWAGRDCHYDAALALGGADAEERMREGLGELQRMGARPAATIVARRLREGGARDVRLGPRAATRANPAGLTARQMDVLGLLARGDRNADIAAKLFVSEKTVDHHVSAILRKLGVRTRGQAGLEAARLGIGADAP